MLSCSFQLTISIISKVISEPTISRIFLTQDQNGGVNLFLKSTKKMFPYMICPYLDLMTCLCSDADVAQTVGERGFCLKTLQNVNSCVVVFFNHNAYNGLREEEVGLLFLKLQLLIWSEHCTFARFHMGANIISAKNQQSMKKAYQVIITVSLKSRFIVLPQYNQQLYYLSSNAKPSYPLKKVCSIWHRSIVKAKVVTYTDIQLIISFPE